MRHIEVLVVEDNAADRFWLEYTLKSFGFDFDVTVASDGEEALDFLLKRGDCSEAPTPDVIFLDTHLPITNGLEVLRQVPNAKELPICVVTSSDAERESFRKEFGIQNSDFVLKPVSFESLAGSSRLGHLRSRLGEEGLTASVKPTQVSSVTGT